MAAVGAPSNVFSMQLNCYTDFVKQIGLVDGNIIKYAASDTEFITMNKRTKASPLIPGVALVRFQFIEVLMRLAFKRYEETKVATSKAEAVSMMLRANLAKHYSNVGGQKWREERYWNEEVDNVLKSHFPILDKLYKGYGGKYVKPGEKHYMMADEFSNLN